MSLLKIILLWLLLSSCVFAEENNLSLDLQHVNLTDAVRLVGKFLQYNLILSPAINGTVTLSLHAAEPHAAFDLLLKSQGLMQTHVGDVMFVATQAEIFNQKTEALKFATAWNEVAPLLTQLWQMHYAKADDLAHVLQEGSASLLSARGHVRIDVRTNTLCVQDTEANLAAIAKIIKKLDVPVQQVLIEARLTSMDSDFERELGVSFSARDTLVGNGKLAVTNPINPNHFSLAVARLADGSYLDVALAAMENEGRGELISSPSLFTANQQTASIESGEEIPYQEISLSGGTAIAFKKAVLSLKVTPQILPGDKVLLQLQVNQDRPSSRIVQGVPAISTRQIITNVLVKNGQTLVLGGIYEMDDEHNISRVPFLGRIPIVGLLFQQQNAKKDRRELLIFVTPKIIT